MGAVRDAFLANALEKASFGIGSFRRLEWYMVREVGV